MKTFEKISVSFFKKLNHLIPNGDVNIEQILTGIKNGKWKSPVSDCISDPDKKKNLPAFTPTGCFHQRNTQGLYQYSGLICLDIDHVPDPNALKEKCSQIPWVWVAFITPSGKGLKVLIKTDSPVENFKNTEAEVAFAFYQSTGFIRDERCKDLARLQFVSYDPDIFQNQNPEVFEKRSHIAL